MEPINLEDAIRSAIGAATEADDSISLAELIGTLELIKAELLVAALEPSDDDEEADAE